MVEPKKSLGQNFLVDQNVVRDLIDAAKIGKKDVVLEVGAGTGTVTKRLAQTAGKVIAVEFDRDLIPALRRNLSSFKNVEILNADILDVNFNDLDHFKVVGAIPYQITSPLIHKILHSSNRPKSITFVVQKEVAEKIAAKAPDATYLSNFVANFGEARIIKVIKPGAFSPQPKVDSAIIHITLYPKPKVEDTLKLEKFLHHGFVQPRKMLHHRFEDEILVGSKIPPQARAAHLSKEDWHNIYREIVRVRERVKSRRGDGTWRN
ncbi:ribosomal RNA small subunit methyltransferase A [candidate division WWE3 bacterium RIFCSPLOWO2_02_FULL_53_10]|uniref:Ribosomal RNA small subunit methyltransferase A n=1 Tax=candidate division WWE3 bacterium RIFCSPLOWO2_02_FULL_53_10 TaxID=1802629 RepID=A0A1F4W892_UNCKA|nr:MAG: ribosomal RNA small subunit methyltransferase A [candidate division WWE3 bacterium RIFCSPLOWO2_02_FULL_53_10]